MATPDEPSDRVLVSRCLEGDAHAWDALVERHRAAVQRGLAAVLRAGEAREAADLEQEVWAKLLREGGAALRGLRLAGPASLPAFLYRTARRAALDHRRGQRPLDALEAAEAVAAAGTPETETWEKQKRGRLRDALDRLSGPQAERDRRILQAHFVEGLSAAEIAAREAELTVKGVESLLARGRQQVLDAAASLATPALGTARLGRPPTGPTAARGAARGPAVRDRTRRPKR